MVREPDATMQSPPQDHQLMSKHRVLDLIVPSATSEHLTEAGVRAADRRRGHALAAAADLEATRCSTRMHQRLLGF